MRIQHNIPAMSSYRNYTNNTSALAKNLEKLSSGYKINRAGDDAAGLAISEKMRAQITGLEVAQKNAKDGISLVQTAEGALTEVHSMLNRMYELAEQSANGTYADEVDREQLQKEVDELRTEINRIADSSNFNGINLLDGSLSKSATATKIDIQGVLNSKSLGIAGEYEVDDKINTLDAINALTALDTGKGVETLDGRTFTFSVALDDNTSRDFNFTLRVDSTTKEAQWEADDGQLYPTDPIDADLTADAGQLALLEALRDGIKGELGKSDLADKYNITMENAGTGDEQYNTKIKFTALEAGTATPEVSAFNIKYTDKTGAIVGQKETVKVTQAKNDGREIKADDITEYNGENYDKAVFTINGKKFVLLTENMTAADSTTDAKDKYLRAVAALGDDVTVLVGGTDGLKKGTDTYNANFDQNCKAIEKATGLKVEDAIDETTPSGAAPGEGIRLSIDSKKTVDKSLMLQIGDTAESFNQLRVSINDCHAEAIGIGGIDISTQAGAASAMAKIKSAINYVSDVRGTLGATQNRLDHTINNLSVMQENIQDAESTIRDVDVAKEMMEYTKNNILVQSAQAMLAQANQLPQGVLQLLQ